MHLEQKRLFLLDLDGTLYLGETLYPQAREFLQYLLDTGRSYRFLTNNSSRGVDTYLEKMQRLGLPAQPEDFLTSVDALEHHLKENRNPGDVYYVCGTESLKRQLRTSGFHLTEEPGPEVSALICGLDTELTYRKIENACILLERGVDFLATHLDMVCPTPYGFAPDCGSICEMLRNATGRTPFVTGKPRPEMALLAMERTGLSPEQTVMIGDRLNTDIACGAHAGVDTALLLTTGETVESAAGSAQPPTAIYPEIAQLLTALKEADL